MSILNDGLQQESTGVFCKPDPEDMIARAQKEKAGYTQIIEAVDLIDSAGVYLDAHEAKRGLTEIYGAAHLGIKKCGDEIERWMAEIDGEIK